jgi:hypothetical protein
MANPVRFRVHERQVGRYIMPGGEVNDLIWDIAKDTRTIARKTAPRRTGKLAGATRANRPKPTGLLRAAALVYNNAGHVLHVHDGTPTITAKGKGYLTIPRENYAGGPINPSGGTLRRQWLASGGYGSGEPKPYFTTRSVRGQDAQPFLANALSTAMLREGRLTYTRW